MGGHGRSARAELVGHPRGGWLARPETELFCMTEVKLNFETRVVSGPWRS